MNDRVGINLDNGNQYLVVNNRGMESKLIDFIDRLVEILNLFRTTNNIDMMAINNIL